MSKRLNEKKQAMPTAENLSDQLERATQEFTDSSGVSTTWLEFGSWYVGHKKMFFLSTVWALSITAAVLWSFCLYYFAYYLFWGIKQDQQNVYGLTEAAVTAQRAPDPALSIDYSFVRALPLDSGRYDLVGSISNHNNQAWLSFSYYFVLDGQPAEENLGFVFPNETKYLLALGQAVGQPPTDYRLVVRNLTVNKLTTRNMPDWLGYKSDRLSFTVKDKTFTPASQTGLSEKLSLNRLTFSLKNETIYNYRTADFIIILYNQSSVVGANRYTLSDFQAGEQRQVDMTILGNIGVVTKIDVVPDINIFNSSVYSGAY